MSKLNDVANVIVKPTITSLDNTINLFEDILRTLRSARLTINESIEKYNSGTYIEGSVLAKVETSEVPKTRGGSRRKTGVAKSMDGILKQLSKHEQTYTLDDIYNRIRGIDKHADMTEKQIYNVYSKRLKVLKLDPYATQENGVKHFKLAPAELAEVIK